MIEYEDADGTVIKYPSIDEKLDLILMEVKDDKNTRGKVQECQKSDDSTAPVRETGANARQIKHPDQ